MSPPSLHPHAPSRRHASVTCHWLASASALPSWATCRCGGVWGVSEWWSGGVAERLAEWRTEWLPVEIAIVGQADRHVRSLILRPHRHRSSQCVRHNVCAVCRLCASVTMCAVCAVVAACAERVRSTPSRSSEVRSGSRLRRPLLQRRQGQRAMTPNQSNRRPCDRRDQRDQRGACGRERA